MSQICLISLSFLHCIPCHRMPLSFSSLALLRHLREQLSLCECESCSHSPPSFTGVRCS